MRNSPQKHLLISLLSSILFFSVGCSNYNPKLEGKWQLTYFKSSQPIQLPIDSLFYNFTNNIFMIQNFGAGNTSGQNLYGEFHQYGDSLILTVVDDWYTLSNYYWTSKEKRFKILEISSSSLWLSDKDATYHFRSY